MCISLHIIHKLMHDHFLLSGTTRGWRGGIAKPELGGCSIWQCYEELTGSKYWHVEQQRDPAPQSQCAQLLSTTSHTGHLVSKCNAGLFFF